MIPSGTVSVLKYANRGGDGCLGVEIFSRRAKNAGRKTKMAEHKVVKRAESFWASHSIHNVWMNLKLERENA